MSMKMILALALCVSLTGATAWAKDGEKKNKKKDGKNKIEAKFEEMDTNKDGSISKDEFIAFHKEHKGKHEKKDK